jgi:hypothetical protein
MLRVTMRSHTKFQQAALISDALGAYRPKAPPGYLTKTASENVTTTFGTQGK